MAGATFEDFEDVNIVPGLLIESQVPGTGGYGPTSTLPNTFDPRNTAAGGNDPASNIFQPGLWDGTHLLINRADNRMTGITNNYNDNRWGDVTFHTPGGATVFGVSLENNELNAAISVNGTFVGNTSSFLPLGGGRNGYLRINATGNDTIFRVRFDNSGNLDAIAYDHAGFVPAAVAAVPEPSVVILLTVGAMMGLIGHIWRRRKQVGWTE